jgi:hypothetical protein
MSQVRKYDSGGVTVSPEQKAIMSTQTQPVTPLANPNPKLKFQINGQDVGLDPQSLQDSFEPVFEKMKSAGVAKERNRTDMFNTFQQFVNQAKSGTYNINSSNGKYLNSTYSGADGANLGVNSDGTNSIKSGIGNIISPHTHSDHQNMALLNTYLGDHLIQNHTSDVAAQKVKSDADAAKALSDKNSTRDEYLSGINKFQSPNTAIYGNVGGNDPNWALGDYWKQKEGQGSILKGTFERMGSSLFDKGLDDTDNAKEFKNKWGLSVGDARSAFTKRGFTNGQFSNKDMTMQDLQGLSQDLQLKKNYDGYFERATPQGAQTANTAKNTTTPEVSKSTNAPYFNTGNTRASLDKAGTLPYTGEQNIAGKIKYYENGNLFSGLRVANGGKVESDLEDSKTGYYLNGEKTNKDQFYNKAPQDIIDATNSVNKKIQEHLGAVHGSYQDLSNTDVGKNPSDQFAFNDYIKSGKPLPKATEISSKYGDRFSNPNERLYAYESSQLDQLGNKTTRYRYVSPHGKTIDGVLKTNREGNDYLTDGTTNVHLGSRNDTATASREDSFNRPYLGGNKPQSKKGDIGTPFSVDNFLNGTWMAGLANQHKTGGIIKKQFGGILSGQPSVVKNNTDYHTANVKEAMGNYGGLSTADKVELGGLVAQIGSVVGDFVPVPGASIASAGLGLGATAAQETSDYMKHGFKWGDVAGTLGSVGLDLASSLPGLGEVASATKLAKMVKGSAKVLLGGFAAVNAVGALHSLNKVVNDQDVTIDDWKNIAGGIQGLVAGKRMSDEYVATKPSVTNMVKVDGKFVPIEALAASAIGNAPVSKKLDVAKDVLKDSGLDLTKLDLTNATQKNFLNKSTFGLLGSKDEVQVPQMQLKDNGRQLIDYNNANRYQRGAIKNTVAQNPNIVGANNYTIGENGPRANDESFPGLNWIANSYKMKYAPNIEPVDLKADTYPNGSFSTVLQLPHSTGKVEGGKYIRQTTRPMPQFAGRSSVEERVLPSTGPKSENDTPTDIITKALTNSKVGKNYRGVKFKDGGRIPKFQDGRFINFLQPNLLQGQTDEDTNLSSGDLIARSLGVPKITSDSLYSNPNRLQSVIPKTDVANPDKGNSRVEGDNFWGGVGKTLTGLEPKNLNPSAVSELGRAVYTRLLNSQIDTRVERPMVSAPTEVPISVHGNLSAITAANQGANDLMRNTGIQQTSDAALNAGALINAGFKGAQLREQGNAQSNDMLEKTRQMSLQQQTQAAQARNTAANQNVETNARATQAERAALNDKMGRMNQPFVSYWQAQDADNNQQFQQQRQINIGLGQTAIQNQYNLETRPLMMQMNQLQMRNSQLEYKMRTNTATDSEQKEYNDNNKQLGDIYTKSYGWQNLLQRANLLNAKNYGNGPALQKGYFANDTIPTNEEGGILSVLIGKHATGGVAATITGNSRIAVEQSKENAANIRQSRTNAAAAIKEEAETQSKENLENSKQIQQLIMKALS